METDYQPLQCRLFTPEDHEMVNGWRRERNCPELSASILPKLGVIVEQLQPGIDTEPLALASAHLYMDNSAPICWPEWVTTRPGLLTGLSREAVRTALAFFEYRVAGDYAVMIARCNGVIAREMENIGFQRTADNQITLVKQIPGRK